MTTPTPTKDEGMSVLDRLVELEREATPGEWVLEPLSFGQTSIRASGSYDLGCSVYSLFPTASHPDRVPIAKANARLIATTRNHLPALLRLALMVKSHRYNLDIIKQVLVSHDFTVAPHCVQDILDCLAPLLEPAAVEGE